MSEILASFFLDFSRKRHQFENSLRLPARSPLPVAALPSVSPIPSAPLTNLHGLDRSKASWQIGVIRVWFPQW